MVTRRARRGRVITGVGAGSTRPGPWRPLAGVIAGMGPAAVGAWAGTGCIAGAASATSTSGPNHQAR